MNVVSKSTSGSEDTYYLNMCFSKFTNQNECYKGAKNDKTVKVSEPCVNITGFFSCESSNSGAVHTCTRVCTESLKIHKSS